MVKTDVHWKVQEQDKSIVVILQNTLIVSYNMQFWDAGWERESLHSVSLDG